MNNYVFVCGIITNIKNVYIAKRNKGRPRLALTIRVYNTNGKKNLYADVQVLLAKNLTLKCEALLEVGFHVMVEGTLIDVAFGKKFKGSYNCVFGTALFSYEEKDLKGSKEIGKIFNNYNEETLNISDKLEES